MAIMITGCLSTFLVLQLDEFRPKVGDIVAFKPGSEDTDMWQITIPATSVSAIGLPLAECSLDPNVMAANGGSLVVEGVEDKPSLRYRVHWAGSATAKTSRRLRRVRLILCSRARICNGSQMQPAVSGSATRVLSA